MAESSGEKTEKASAKKKRDAREKGEVHKSMDLCSAIMLFALFGVLQMGFSSFWGSLTGFTVKMLDSSYVADQSAQLSAGSVQLLYQKVLLDSLSFVLPFMGMAMLVGALTHILQTGPMFTPKKLKPDFNKINPLHGFKRIFSSVTVVELGKSSLKIIILGWLIYKTFLRNIEGFERMTYMDVGAAFLQIMQICFSMGVSLGLALIAFSAVDIIYQWWKFEKDLMMTKQEVKDENKQLEGDPQIKSKIKQKQRKMSAMRMMQKVPEADVVITNPTHFAVAIRYKDTEDSAPVVVAKGQDYLAQRIKKIAAEHKIVMVENRAVARALYAACEVGDEIPMEMYQAIADILIYVYKVNNKI